MKFDSMTKAFPTLIHFGVWRFGLNAHAPHATRRVALIWQADAFAYARGIDSVPTSIKHLASESPGTRVEASMKSW